MIEALAVQQTADEALAAHVAAHPTAPFVPSAQPPAAAVAPVAEPVGAGAGDLPESESVNVWPDDSAEAAFMAEARERGEPAKAAPQVVEEVEDREGAKALPKLDELVAQIPAETRELLEDLFRAKFVAVRRVKKADLKS